MGVDRHVFYDESRIAIIPMGYCYPGRGNGGDKPPRRECATLWLDQMLARPPPIELKLLIGHYSPRPFFGSPPQPAPTPTGPAWPAYPPDHLPPPPPTPRQPPRVKQ